MCSLRIFSFANIWCFRRRRNNLSRVMADLPVLQMVGQREEKKPQNFPPYLLLIILIFSKISRHTVGHKIMHILQNKFFLLLWPINDSECINEPVICPSSFSRNCPPGTIQWTLPPTAIPVTCFLSVDQNYAQNFLHLHEHYSISPNL